jgi:hypothetical protein
MIKIILLTMGFAFCTLAHAETSVDVPVGDGPAVNVTDVKNRPPPASSAENSALVDDNEPSTPAPTPSKKAKKAAPDKATVHDDDSGKPGDTYNFYFQKGSGPGSVEQGHDQQRAAPQNGGDQTQSAPRKKMQEFYILPAVELQVGLVSSPGASGFGVFLGSQFNMGESFGLQAHLFSMKMENGDSNSTIGDGSITTNSGSGTGNGASLAVTYAPMVGDRWRVSLVGGAMFLSVETDSTYIGDGGIRETSSKESKFLPFVGVAASAYLTHHFGLVGYGNVASEPKYSQIGFGVAWLL